MTDAGRAAVLETVEWLIAASIGDIVAETGVGRGEAREMKHFAERCRILQALAAKRAAPRPASFWEGVVTHSDVPHCPSTRVAIRAWAGIHDPAAELDLPKVNEDRLRLGLPIFVMRADGQI